MKFQALFLIAMIASTMSLSLFQKYPINYSSRRNIYSVLTEIKAKIASGGPLDAVVHLLDDIKQAVQDEQSRHDAVSGQQNQECDAELSFRNQEIDDAQEALTTGNDHLNRCQHDLSEAQTNLANNLQSQKDNRENLETLINNRRDDSTVYLARVDDHNNALQAISEAVEMLNDIFEGEVSFSQLSKISATMLKHAVKIRATKFYAPIASILAQIASKKVLADSATLEKVKSLLQKLSENLRASLALYQEQEARDLETFNTRKAELEAIIAELEAAEKTFRDEISSNENCVATQTQVIGSATTKLNRNTDFLAQAQSMCDNFKQEYEAASEKRNDEIKLIDEVRKIVEARYGEISKEVTQRGTEEVSQWAAGNNAYAVKKPEAFQHQGGKLNEAGSTGAGFQRRSDLEDLLQKKKQ